jgi:hypothetical protein
MTRRRSATALVLVFLILAVLAAAWLFRDRIAFGLAGSDPVEVSPEAAEAAQAKLTRLLEDGAEARLSETEVTSLLRYGAPGFAGGTVEEPSIRLSGETLTLTGTVATESLPSHPELDAVRPFLPDRAPIEVEGRVRTLAGGRAAFEVESVEFASLPIPRRYYPEMLERIGRRDEPGLAPTALAMKLPPGVGEIRVEGGYLILTP